MPGSKKGKLETILVVESDAVILNTVVTLLKAANFKVLSAPSADLALKVAQETEGEIELALSAVELPGMSGPDLGNAFKKFRPGIHVMLMSGQADGNLLVLNYGWAYIQKQMLAAKLVEMINSVLHSPNRSQLGDEYDSAKDVRMAR